MKNLAKTLSYKELLLMWFPLVLSALFNELYGLINTVITSHYINSSAIAVMGSVGPFSELQSYVFNGMTLGFGLVVCREFEKKDLYSYRTTCKMAFQLTGILCVFAMILVPLSPTLLRLYNVPDALRESAAPYLVFLFLECITLATKNILVTIINGMGEMKIVGIVSTAGVLLDSFFAYLLIGILGTDVWGSSCAVFITDFILSIFLLFAFIKKNHEYQAQFESGNTELASFPSRLSEMLRSGCAKPIMMGFVAVGAFFFQYAINSLSPETIAGLSYADRVFNIFMAPLCSMASLSAAISAHNTTAWNAAEGTAQYTVHLDLSENKRKMDIISLIWSFISILMICIFAPVFISLLGESGMSQEIITAGAWKLRIGILGFPLLGLYLMDRAVFHAMGKNRFMPLLGFVEMLLAIIGAVFFIPTYGYIAAAIFIFLKWSIPGIVSEISLRKHI